MKAAMSLARSYELARRVMRQPVLTLTLGPKTGWALHWDPDHVTSGVESFGVERADELGPRAHRFRLWPREMISLSQPGLVVYERPTVHEGLRRKALPAALQLEGVLLAELETAFHEEGLDCRYVGVPLEVVTDFATGFMPRRKGRLLATARLIWRRDVQDEHQATGLCLLALAIWQSAVSAARFPVQEAKAS